MYSIIPVINEPTWPEIVKKIELVKKFSNWIHIDVTDGQYSSHATWHEPGDLDNLANDNISLELHLMIANPEEHIKSWLKKGVKRVIVHYETIKDFNLLEETVLNAGASLMLSFVYDMDMSRFLADQRHGSEFQILAVKPGLAGQKFNNQALDKIRLLRKKFRFANIEVDGGINDENIKNCKDAGANIFVAASYIWNSKNPESAYNKLSDLIF